MKTVRSSDTKPSYW